MSTQIILTTCSALNSTNITFQVWEADDRAHGPAPFAGGPTSAAVGSPPGNSLRTALSPCGAAWNQVTRAHLDRRLDGDPGRKHQTGIQRLGSHAEVHAAPGIAGPDVLVSAGQAGQLHSSCGHMKETHTL